MQQCQSMPIFAPGQDVAEPAAHDSLAIQEGQPNVLTAQTSDEASQHLSRGWYDLTANQPPNRPNACFTEGARDDGLDCDEYPFYSTAQSSTQSSLKLTNASENRREGAFLAAFYSACGLTQHSNVPTEADYLQRNYLVIPQTLVWVNTAAWCGA